MRRIVLLMLTVALSVTLMGCGGARERGRNKDYDRPSTQK